MRATAQVDQTLCLGTGLCEAMDSRLFQLGDNSTAVARPVDDEDGDGDQDGGLERLLRIAECCPTGAINIATTEDE